jgi:hypothetical protein
VRQLRTLGSVREECRSAPWSTYTRTQLETADRAKEDLQPAAPSSTRKPNRSGEARQEFSITPNGSFRLTNATVRMLIRIAYRVQDFQILAPPSWTDIDASM